ncbi:hypothetical protein [Chromobacterium haemolyticum]|uniref:hypothetical protein n=1 Tax=Chromobacterium haemolyticum TaxID=394935 RepID=UPI002447D6E4|nr:hypothetical protein [Chromobacterium haemolyticum]MDH0340606.1 hypothetical protein [Chromobacterium haemolyticum]
MKAEIFEDWADLLEMTGSSREAVRLMKVAGASPSEAARATALHRSVTTRAAAKFEDRISEHMPRIKRIAQSSPD